MSKSTVDSEELVSIGKASRYVGLSTSRIRQLVAKGVIPCFRTPSGHRRFKLSDLDLLRERKGKSSFKYFLSEEDVVSRVTDWLESEGYVILSPERSSSEGKPDIVAEKGEETVVIEVKGSQNPTLMAYMAVGEIVRYREEWGEKAKYYIAGPPEVISKVPVILHQWGFNMIMVTHEGVNSIRMGEHYLLQEATWEYVKQPRFVFARVNKVDFNRLMEKAKLLKMSPSRLLKAIIEQWQILMENPLFMVLREGDLVKVLREPLVMSVKRLSELKEETGRGTSST